MYRNRQRHLPKRSSMCMLAPDASAPYTAKRCYATKHMLKHPLKLANCRFPRILFWPPRVIRYFSHLLLFYNLTFSTTDRVIIFLFRHYCRWSLPSNPSVILLPVSLCT